ncbi:uncharacterized protein Dsimw501_GD27181 [Drosophila simulans]|nr:uncharacterized protein Dsimw501_GD27181 [Drosophila simulans]
MHTPYINISMTNTPLSSDRFCVLRRRIPGRYAPKWANNNGFWSLMADGTWMEDKKRTHRIEFKGEPLTLTTASDILSL